MKELYKSFLDRLRVEKSVKIYGAGKFARTLCRLCDRKHIKVDFFVVTEREKNPTELLSRPVIALDQLPTSDLCNIVVGFEKREEMKRTVSFLLAHQVKNIIMVHPDLVNEIYCNFLIDEYSVQIFCEELRKRKKIIAYINDEEGEIILQYLKEKDIQIEAVCTDLPALLLSDNDTPVLSYEEMSEKSNDSTVVLTMNNVFWQRGFITKLRKSGFENIVLISEEIMQEIKQDHMRMVWESGKSGFHIVETVNIEKDFYAVQNDQGGGQYRWRVALWDRRPFKKEILENIRNGKMLEAYEKQFPNFNYLPYEEVLLGDIHNRDMNIEVYIARFHKDKITSHVVLPDWVIPIQVGKALTNIRIAEVCDDTGDNISLKNVDYSEGTALYWMWKNTHGQDYIGLFQYRRQMAMGADTLLQLSKYDVLLTVPTYILESIKDFFCQHFILEYDWKLMMKYIKQYDESYYETALKYEREQCYFSCNIFIMRRKYFDEMCSFIFSVLEKVDSYYNSISMVRKDRYLGYLVENLLSIYMMHNARRLKAAYTDMKFNHSLNN